MQLMTNAVQLLMTSGTQQDVQLPQTFCPWGVCMSTCCHPIAHYWTARLCDKVLEDGALNTKYDAFVATMTQQTAAIVTMGSTLGGMNAALLTPTNLSPLLQDCTAAAMAINLSANQIAMWAHMLNMSLRDVVPPTHVANPAMYFNPTSTAAAYVLPQVQAPTQGYHHLCCNNPNLTPRRRIQPWPRWARTRGTTLATYRLGWRGSQSIQKCRVGARYSFCPRWSSPTSVWSIPTNSGPCSGPTQLYSHPRQDYNNWDVCYSCGFDIKDKHTLATCLIDWCRTTHCKKSLRNNAQAYINSGHNVCTKGIHMTMLPQYRLA
jgi:hypothetical protein